MAAFDWVAFLSRMGIEFVERGPNVARDHIGLQCPWCGSADRSHHMGISLLGKGWGCFRDDRHRGRAPERLVMRLARCSWEEAHAIVRSGVSPADVGWDVLRAKLQDQMELTSGYPPAKELEFPPELLILNRHDELRGRFLDYIEGRGFSRPQVVAHRYGLRGALRGDFKARLVFPIWIDGKLVGWTARAIMQSKIRYKIHPSGDAASGFLWNYDRCYTSGGRVLAVCEGTVDAMKVDFFGRDAGIRAVALLGLSLTTQKMALLGQLSERFDSIALLLDADALHKSMDFRAKLSWLSCPLKIAQLPTNVKDPGDLMADEVVPIFSGI